MPDFTAQIQRTVVHTISIDVVADDEEQATEIAEKLCNQANDGRVPTVLDSTKDWDEDNTEYEVNTVDED